MTSRLGPALKEPLKRAQDELLSWRARRAHPEAPTHPPVAIAAQPRTGSTWLMELLTVRSGLCPLYEPLHPDRDRLVRRLNDGLPLRIRPGESRPDVESLLGEILAGRRITRWSSSQAGPARVMAADRFVAKFLRINGSLAWFCATFPDCPVIVLLRHPCATVDSMLRSPGPWSEIIAGTARAQVVDALGPEAGSLVQADASPYGLLAALWAIEVRMALAETSPDQVQLVTYETLVTDPLPTAESLYAAMAEPIPANLAERAGRASRTANADAAVRQGRDPLSDWTTRIPVAERGEILATTGRFGLDFYGAGPEPDLETLNRTHATLTA